MTTKEIEQAFGISNMLPNRALKDDAEILQFVKHCVGISNAFTDSFTTDKSVIEDIKTEIKDLHKSHMINFVSADGAVDTCLEIIDKHIGRGDESV